MLQENYGPTVPMSIELHASKYRNADETFYDRCCRIASALADGDDHRRAVKDILLDMAFLPAGRVQRSVGAPQQTTPYNCFVSGDLPDESRGIFDRLSEAFQTLRLGGGIGTDFSSLRPSGDPLRSINSTARGPLPFMNVFNAAGLAVKGSGDRDAAQMGVLRIDHPDIQKFIVAKQNETELRGMNISVAVTDEFMEALASGKSFATRFNGVEYQQLDARSLWNSIMRSTWDWAEPGILFIDRINQMNNLWYCETIRATNPCGEQPLPAYGACLLGSFNLTKCLRRRGGRYIFDFETFTSHVHTIVRAMDNVVDRAVYPLLQQELEAKNKRRMGLGVTGMANTLEIMGLEYGSESYIEFQSKILAALRDEAYSASAYLAEEKGSFPLFDADKYLGGRFVETLPDEVKNLIDTYGIRNSHLTSIAPTGTISLSADNISSGIEPVFRHEFDRTYRLDGVDVKETVTDFAFREYAVRGRPAEELAPSEHVAVLCAAQQYVDSACSKTCNIGDGVSWEDFQAVYLQAWEGGAKGCTTYRAAGKRAGIFSRSETKPATPVVVSIPTEFNLSDVPDQATACTYDPLTGIRSCE